VAASSLLSGPQRSFSSRRRNNVKSKNSETVLANENLLRTLRKKFPNAQGPDHIEVRLVIDEGGDEPSTVMVCSLAEAIEESLDRMTDLIGVSLQSDPPVIRAAQLSKLEYQKEQASAKQKSASKSKQKKTFRFRAGIDIADLNRKIQVMINFLESGTECEYTVFSRARMMRENAGAGMQLVEQILELLSHCAVQKNAPQKNENGNHIRVVMIPKKS
jgi:translation initiation factor IF-3